jgi:thioredoxin-like negative regulator of GroEL
MALEAIADAQDDVDAFIAQQSEKARGVPSVAVEIAQRLLAAGRADEAWAAINAVDQEQPGWIPVEWEQTRFEVLEALGRADEAQAFR